MQSRSSFNYIAHLARLQSECSLFELLLHISLAKESKVSHLPSATAVRFTNSELSKRRLATTYAIFMAQDYALCLFLRPFDVCLTLCKNAASSQILATYLTPATRPSTILMFYQQVACADLSIISSGSIRPTCIMSALRSAMMFSHVCLELLCICSRWWLPS